MNKLIIDKARAVYKNGKYSKIMIENFTKTLEYEAYKLAKNYFTPDDGFFHVSIEGETGYPIVVNLKFTPISVGAKHQKPMYIIAKYKNDVDLSCSLYDDIMLCLEHMGLYALYNNGKEIEVTIHNTTF